MDDDSASSKPDDGKSKTGPFLRSGLITLLAGLSITALFAATGFIAAFGREQFLGINLSDWSGQSLTILAGRCIADSFFLVLNLAARYWIVLSVVAVIVGGLVVVVRHRRLPAWMPAAAECLLAIPLLFWLITAVTSFEAPTIALRGWVIGPSDAGGAAQCPLATAIQQLHTAPSTQKTAQQPASQPAGQDEATEKRKKRMRDAIDQAAPSSAAASPGVTRLGSYYFAKHTDGPGALLLEASSDDVADQLHTLQFPLHHHEEAQNLLYDGYARVVAACIFALLYVLLSGQCPESKFWSDLLTVLRTGIIAASAVATVLIPYTYGKLIDSSLFPDCYITYNDPTAPLQNGKSVPISGQFPVVSRTEQAISLLWVQAGSGATQIIEVPADKVVKLEYFSDVDALAKISHCLQSETTAEGPDCQ